MTKYFAFLFIQCFILTGYAQPKFELPAFVEESIHSRFLNEKRRLWISVPGERESDTTKFHVLYLLDPEPFFTLVSGIVQLKSEFERSCPPMIIVGILNEDRIKDFTPTHSLISVDGKENAELLKSSGGAEAFTQFLHAELIPFVDSRYPTKPERTIIGHSLGGLLVLNTLVHHPEIFDNYICVDPSTWWDNRKVLEQASGSLQGERFGGKKFCLAVANNAAPNDSLMTNNPPAERPIVQFAETLKNTSHSPRHLAFFWKYYPHEDHATVIYSALANAIDNLWK